MKKIVILGSTGQIGRQTLDVIRAYPEEFKVIGLSGNKNTQLLEKQAQEFKPRVVAIGEDELVKITTLPEVDLVVVAVVGVAGLKPTLSAIKSGKDIALATKEVLVIAGQLVMNEVKKNKVNLFPIDSEHSAIYQCLLAGRKNEIRRLILTIGKGPIAKMNKADLKKVTIKDIFKRPAWQMGNKIAVDSASCLNKSFEVIEARWLFDVAPEKINVVVHPEYLCHSLVEFNDGGIIAEIGIPDMRRYIQYALFCPERKKNRVLPFLNLVGKKMTFEQAPFNKFPGLKLGFKALEAGGTMSAVMHGADEVAVKKFIEGKIDFTQIPEIIDKTMDKHRVVKNPNLTEIFEAENWGKTSAQKLILK